MEQGHIPPVAVVDNFDNAWALTAQVNLPLNRHALRFAPRAAGWTTSVDVRWELGRRLAILGLGGVTAKAQAAAAARNDAARPPPRSRQPRPPSSRNRPTTRPATACAWCWTRAARTGSTSRWSGRGGSTSQDEDGTKHLAQQLAEPDDLSAEGRRSRQPADDVAPVFFQDGATAQGHRDRGAVTSVANYGQDDALQGAAHPPGSVRAGDAHALPAGIHARADRDRALLRRPGERPLLRGARRHARQGVRLHVGDRPAPRGRARTRRRRDRADCRTGSRSKEPRLLTGRGRAARWRSRRRRIVPDAQARRHGDGAGAAHAGSVVRGLRARQVDRPADVVDGQLEGVTFRTSRWRNPAGMLAGIGFKASPAAPSGDIELKAMPAPGAAVDRGIRRRLRGRARCARARWLAAMPGSARQPAVAAERRRGGRAVVAVRGRAPGIARADRPAGPRARSTRFA